MKTPQQIIDELPDGNRKRACVILAAAMEGENSRFWAYAELSRFDLAAQFLVSTQSDRATAVLADMIWEG